MSWMPFRASEPESDVASDSSGDARESGTHVRLRSDDELSGLARSRVIVADDDADARALMVNGLSHLGFDVTVVHDGQDLLDLLYSLPPQWFRLVVVDQRMPRLRGLEVIACSASRTKFIMVTAYADAGLEATATALGAKAFFAKPFDMEAFLDLVCLEIVA